MRDTLRSLRTILPSSSSTMISTSTKGEKGLPNLDGVPFLDGNLDFANFWETAGEPGILRRKADNGAREWESIISAGPGAGLSGLQDSAPIIRATLPIFCFFTGGRIGDGRFFFSSLTTLGERGFCLVTTSRFFILDATDVQTGAGGKSSKILINFEFVVERSVTGAASTTRRLRLPYELICFVRVPSCMITGSPSPRARQSRARLIVRMPVFVCVQTIQ